MHTALFRHRTVPGAGRTCTKAKFCLPYTMAVAFLDRKVGLEQYTDERLADAVVRAFMSRIRVTVPDDLQRHKGQWGENGVNWGEARIAIRLRDGRVLTQACSHAKGWTERPCTWQDLCEKFEDCAARVLDKQQVHEAIELIAKLDAARFGQRSHSGARTGISKIILDNLPSERTRKRRAHARFRKAGWALFVLVLHHTVAAQGFPEKPIRVIVPFPPGGGADIVVRAFAPSMADQLGKQVIVDNRPGGSGIIGMELGAKAAPDGHTLVIGITGTLAINPTVFPKLPYDPIESYAPISLAAVGPNVLVVHPSLPARNIRELVALAKQQPGSISYASSGTGGAPHLAGELLKYMAKIDIVHIPTRARTGNGRRRGWPCADDVRRTRRGLASHQKREAQSARRGGSAAFTPVAGGPGDRGIPAGVQRRNLVRNARRTARLIR